MDELAEPKRATVHDVAKTAGVSLATVDRVLNARPGVRPETQEKVESAIKALNFRRDLSASLLARARDLRITFLIPDGGNAFMESLTAAIARRVRQSRSERLTLTAAQYHALDPGALVARLDALGPAQADCAVVVAPDDPDRTIVGDTLAKLERYAAGMVRGLTGRVLAATSCRYTLTPDEDFIIDTHPEHPQIVIASACSGHGFKFGIEIGRILAALALGRPPGSDLARFRLGRPSLSGAWRNESG